MHPPAPTLGPASHDDVIRHRRARHARSSPGTGSSSGSRVTPATACSSTGDRFTSETASFGNDLSTLPNFPAEIRAPAGTLPGVSSFQLHFANYDILTPGDRPDVLVAMNPAALKANVGDLPAGGMLIVNTDEFTKRNLTKVGYDGLAAGRRLARALHGAPGRDGDADPRRAGGDRPAQEGRRAGEEHVRPRPAVVDVPPAHRGHRAVPAREVRQAARPGRGEHAGVPGRARLRRDHRVVRRDLRGRARAAARRARTGRSPATPRWPTGSWRPGRSPGCRCSSARTRSRRPATSCTS